MQLQALRHSDDILACHLLHRGYVAFRGVLQAAEGGGRIVAFNGTGGIVGAAKLIDQRLLGGNQFFLGKIPVPALLQKPQHFLLYPVFFGTVDAGKNG